MNNQLLYISIFVGFFLIAIVVIVMMCKKENFVNRGSIKPTSGIFLLKTTIPEEEQSKLVEYLQQNTDYLDEFVFLLDQFPRLKDKYDTLVSEVIRDKSSLEIWHKYTEFMDKYITNLLYTEQFKNMWKVFLNAYNDMFYMRQAYELEMEQILTNHDFNKLKYQVSGLLSHDTTDNISKSGIHAKIREKIRHLKNHKFR